MSTSCSVCTMHLSNPHFCHLVQARGVQVIRTCRTCQDTVNLAALGVFQSMTPNTKQPEYDAFIKKAANTVMPDDPLVAKALLTKAVGTLVKEKQQKARQ